ncbi:MAG TPA: FkbM family methyltransferase [Vicinamibacterales bacterium]|nr:FkbM family methyltransferase [Vicinamibacterales bacterium]
MLQQAARGMAGILGRDSGLVKGVRPIYERTLAVLSGNRGIPWTINGEDFRISPFHRHRMGPIYDPAVAAYLAQQVKPGSTCLDVGANVGVYALQFARWTGPSGRVIAFEPNPVAATALAEHLRMNDLAGRVEVVPAAMAETSGMQTFHMAEADGMSRLGAPNPEIAARTRPTSVRVVTLDEFCDRHAVAPDWLLVDVEGFEFAVLAGARRTLARLRGRINVLVEMHPDAWAVAGWSRASAEALLDELGLTAVSLSVHGDPLGDYGHVLLRPFAVQKPDDAA